MVSGFVTSPCDQDRIFSGDASDILIASKSGERFVFSCCVLNICCYLSFAVTRWWRVRAAVRTRRTKRLVRRLHFLASSNQLDVKTKRLKLSDEHVERLRHARIEVGLALYDGLVDLRTARDVVRLGGQQLLENMRGSVCFQRPHLHLSEPLPAELCLSSERLLRDKRVRPDGTRVYLVVDQVRQLHHVDVSDGNLLLERVSGEPVEEHRLAAGRQPGVLEKLLDVFFARTVENRRRERDSINQSPRVIDQIRIR